MHRGSQGTQRTPPHAPGADGGCRPVQILILILPISFGQHCVAPQNDLGKQRMRQFLTVIDEYVADDQTVIRIEPVNRPIRVVFRTLDPPHDIRCDSRHCLQRCT